MSNLNRDDKTNFSDWLKDVFLKKGTWERAQVSNLIQHLFWEGEDVPMTYGLERLMDEIEEKGIEKGKLEGKLEGAHEKAIETAKKALQRNLPIELIMSLTDLSEEEIQNVKQEMTSQQNN